jgi:hypothetical protein
VDLASTTSFNCESTGAPPPRREPISEEEAKGRELRFASGEAFEAGSGEGKNRGRWASFLPRPKG